MGKKVSECSLLEKIELASNENTTLDILEELNKEDSLKISLAIIKNKNASKELIKEILEKNKDVLNIEIAKQPYIDNEIVDLFFKETFFRRTGLVLVVLSNNKSLKNIDEKLQLAILKESERFYEREEIQKNLIKNPFVAREILVRLADSKHLKVKKSLFDLEVLDEEILKILEKDIDMSISLKAKERLKGNNLTTIEKIKFLSNENVGAETLLLYAHDESFAVKLAVLRHKNLPIEIFEMYLKNENKSLEAPLSSYLCKNPKIKDVPFEIQKQFFDSGKHEILISLASNEYTHPKILNLIVENVDYSMYKEALLENPNIDELTLEILSYDEDENISKSAKEKLFKKSNTNEQVEIEKDITLQIDNKSPKSVTYIFVSFCLGAIIGKFIF